MDEYIADVLIDNHRQTIKTYATSIYSAIDILISMPAINAVFSVSCTENGRSWDVEGMDMMAMRQMRADITEEALREAFHDNEHNKTIH
tara:strand:+ start:482 stop:748 length:267 start_codon:yes stop_codon:yes gene_type:complete